jgi:hypothetical protein
MYKFKEFLNKDKFVLALAEQYFNTTIDEAADIAVVYYEKPPQKIEISQHGLDDGKERGRLWWDDEKHLSDPRFTDFADKCLNHIIDPPKEYRRDNDIVTLDKTVGKELGFCDNKEKRGWVVRLMKSEDGKVTSFTIITVLYMPVMDQSKPLFAKPNTYIINIDKPIPKSKDSEYKEIDGKIKDLTDQYEIAYIEADDMPEGKDKKTAVKNLGKLNDQLQALKNRKEKLKSLLSITESLTVTDKLTNREVRFIMV